jgi:hypothetical protein
MAERVLEHQYLIKMVHLGIHLLQEESVMAEHNLLEEMAEQAVLEDLQLEQLERLA